MASAGTPSDTDRGEVDLWEVHLQPPPDELGKLSIATTLASPPHRAFIETELLADGSEGPSKLILAVRASGPDEAREIAQRTYANARQLAGLGPPPAETPLVIGVKSPLFRDRVADLLGEADELVEEGRPELAVVRAQTACELWAKDALEGSFCGILGRPRGETAMKMCQPSMRDPRTRHVIFTVLGVRVVDESWWPAYSEHLTRRNGIVHDGLVVTEKDARASIAAVGDCIDWLRRGWAIELKPDSP